MTDQAQQRRSTDGKRSPESRRYDDLKGRLVIVQMTDSARTIVYGRLDWVDRYSIGVTINEQVTPGAILFASRAVGEPVLLMKQHILGIARYSS